VILFDEIEKGHPDVFNTLLQILDDGRLTDGQGRTVDFKNTVIIMTSNVGSAIIHDSTPMGFSVNQKRKDAQEDVRKRLLDALRQTFRPEFLNRVDDIIVFNGLSKEQLGVIVDLQLKRLEKVLAAERGLKLRVTAAAKDVIVSDGYDPAYGARPMRRSIQRLIQDPLALRLLAGEFLGGETVVVDRDGEGAKLKFEKEVGQVETPALSLA
jgi:ATP-dependent Clp protease ATP-binding subunit ClpA